MLRIIASLIVLLLLTTSAVGQGVSDPNQLRKVDTIRVIIRDNVINGCLPRPNELKAEAEAKLHQAGIKVVETSDESPHILWIIVTGGLIKGNVAIEGCAGSFVLILSRLELLRDETSGTVQSSQMSGVLVSSKDSFQQHIQRSIERYVTQLAGKIREAGKPRSVQ